MESAALQSFAHISCADMAADRWFDPVMDEVRTLQRTNPGVTAQKAASFAGIAAAAYCPQVNRRWGRNRVEQMWTTRQQMMVAHEVGG